MSEHIRNHPCPQFSTQPGCLDPKPHSHPHPGYHPRGSEWSADQTLHVAVAYTNPGRYKSRRSLFENFRQVMARTPNVVLHVAEATYGDLPFEVTEAGHPHDYQFRGKSTLWLKENLLNLAVREFPSDWKYGAYIDGDCTFTRYDWALEAIHQLQHYAWVQLFTQYSDLGPNQELLGTHQSCVKRHLDNLGVPRNYTKGATGLAWAFTRQAFDAVGGFMDKCILGCYDDKTEVFTNRGWLLFSDLTLEDKVLSLSPAKVTEWQPVTKLHRYNYTGPMRQFKSQSMDLLVTPNHRMVYEKQGGVYFEDAREFNHHLKTSRTVPKNQTWVGTLPKELPIDVPIEDWVAFLGLWIAEGWASVTTEKATGSHHYRIGISQTKGEDGQRTGYDKVSSFLDGLPIKWWSDGERDFSGSHKNLCLYLRGLGHRSWEKRIPEEVKNLPPHLLEIFLDWYLLGDGNVDPAKKDNHTDSLRMFTTSPQLRDDLLEVIIKTGRWGAYRIRQPKSSQPLKTGRVITSRRVGYDIWIHRGKSFHIKGRHVTDVDYSGDVFCCETPYHTLLVRRNRKMIWCGNSGDWHMALGLIGEPDRSPEVSQMRGAGAAYSDYIRTWQTRANREFRHNIGVLENYVTHHFHGPKALRQYGERWKILQANDYNPYVDIYPDWQGLYQLTPEKPRLRDGIRRYFSVRSEDDIRTVVTDKPGL